MAQTLLLLLVFTLLPIQAWSYLYLKDRFTEAKVGDYVVTSQKKTFTLWTIRDRDAKQVLIEEISVPSSYLELGDERWKGWVAEGAPGHTTWLMYAIQLSSGKLLGLYSFDNQRWCEVDQNSNFLTTLLNLGFTQMELNMRKRIGPSPSTPMRDQRRYWNPPLIYEGEEIPGIHFDHFQAKWPRDGSELAEKWIDIYLPEQKSKYPSYFPYWLQVSGNIAQAKIRIVDSGSNIKSPLKIQWPKESYQQSPKSSSSEDLPRQEC